MMTLRPGKRAPIVSIDSDPITIQAARLVCGILGKVCGDKTTGFFHIEPFLYHTLKAVLPTNRLIRFRYQNKVTSLILQAKYVTLLGDKTLYLPCHFGE